MLDLTIPNAFIVLKKYLERSNQNKYEHSIRVAQTSKMLAEKWNVSVEDSVIAGLLHDIGKSLNRMQMLAFCARNEIPLYDFEIFDNLSALHGKVSSLFLEKEFNKKDPDRLNAISHAISAHVAGDEQMDMLDKVLFIADNIEPDRGNNLLSRIRSGEITDPDECIRIIIQQKIDKSIKKDRQLNPMLNCTLESLDDGDR